MKVLGEWFGEFFRKLFSSVNFMFIKRDVLVLYAFAFKKPDISSYWWKVCNFDDEIKRGIIQAVILSSLI